MDVARAVAIPLEVLGSPTAPPVADDRRDGQGRASPIWGLLPELPRVPQALAEVLVPLG